MSVATTPRYETVADLLKQLGDVPAARVRMHPTPGPATEQDVIKIHDREGRLFELVDGVLVEKGMGFHESRYAIFLGSYLIEFLRRHKLGTILGIDVILRLFPDLVRIPDGAFISWERYSKSDQEHAAIPTVAPDLVIEVLGKSNRRKEMERKFNEYFEAGVRLVWYLDSKARTVRVYTARHAYTTLTTANELDGGDVLPGFRLAIAEWFAEVEQTGL